MLERSQQLTSRCLQDLLGDSAYMTGMDLAACAAQDVTLYGPWKANDWSGPKIIHALAMSCLSVL